MNYLFKTINGFFKRIHFNFQKNKFYGKETELNFSQIVLESFYTYGTLEVGKSKPIYKNSILFNIIKLNKEEILKNLISCFEYRVKIGLELEFYVLENPNKIDIISQIKKLLVGVENVEKEKGKNQIEIKTKPYDNILKLASEYKKNIEIIKNFAKENQVVFDFSAIPFENDCGSALQANISLIDDKGNNLFARNKNMNESDLMLNCVAGMLKNINNNLLLFIENENCLKRYDLSRNQKLRNDKKYPAPTFISWGINNRTAAIRIPTPNNINLKNYADEDNRNRRIEFRIPSSLADIELTLIGVLSMMLDGLNNNLYPTVEKTSFDVMEKNDKFTAIDCDFRNLNNIFKIYEDTLFF